MTYERLGDPAYWDEAAAAYEAMAQPFTDVFAQAAVDVLELAPGMRVLDVAAGTGAAAAAAARTGAEVTAIDFSPGMVGRIVARGLPRVTARVMDGQALDFPDAVFDASVSVFGVMLFPDWRAGLREMARVTRPGGRAAIAVWRDADGAATTLLLAQVRRALWPDLATPMLDGVATLADPGRVTDAMETAGFADVATTEVTSDFRLKIAALDRAEELFAVSPLWTMLTHEQQAAALAEIRRRAERDGDGEILPVPSTALIATGRR
jgi:ubiquinone/menaquinone biosynthesis C-methylase UbiE